MNSDKKILDSTKELLERIYDEETAGKAFGGIEKLIEKYQGIIQPYADAKALDQSDVILITYGDIVQKEGEKPLRTLGKFLNEKAANVINSVHVLPFYPYSSDDGFSVINYREVDPDLGAWEDIDRLGDDFKLMVDLVANHVSAESEWFQKFKQGVAPYEDYFIEVEPGTELGDVFRPRTLPLLEKVLTENGEKQVWTTFSQDQIDLNFGNYKVLVDMIDILLFYIVKKAKFIRLDAIAYIWKEIGTSCIHLPEVHWIVQIIRNILDLVAPFATIITETNVPHNENVSYFGDGTNEAHMVYNFSLPPLILHAFHTQNAKYLTDWVKGLSVPSDQTAFYNFLASHDGIGVSPLRGILDDDQITDLAHHIEKVGGLVSYKTNTDGSESPYELNINYFDALFESGPDSRNEDVQIKKFICAHAIMFSLKGVPGIYFHSLFGSTGWLEGVEKTGRKRTINRQKLKYEEIRSELEDQNSRRARIYSQLSELLLTRKENFMFDPKSIQTILDLDDRLFCLVRFQDEFKKAIICIHNLSPDNVEGNIERSDLITDDLENIDVQFGKDSVIFTGEKLKFTLSPYSVIWAVISKIS